jgi:hypothetical protein
MKYQDQPEQVALKLKEEAKKKPIGGVIANGWSFGYSLPSAELGYGFSAMLYPKGRSSTTEDWEYLGKVQALVGMPLPDGKEGFTFFTDVATADPNSVLKWFWPDPKAGKRKVEESAKYESVPGTKAILHTDPLSLGQSELAMLLGMLGSAAHLAKSLPDLNLPVHVQIEINGKTFCGVVAAEDASEESTKLH